MADVEKTEFVFPEPGGERESAAAARSKEDNLDVEIEVVDDTPEKDRGRKPLEVAPADVTDAELESYSEKVRKRIQHFNKGYHEERRARESAMRERDEALKLAKMFIDENNSLKGTVNQNQETLLAQAKRVTGQDVADAKRKYKEAYEAGDSDALVAAQEALTSAKFKSERIDNFRPTPLQPTEDDVLLRHSVTTAPVDTRAASWQEENKWFGPDEEMTSFALSTHTKLVRQGIAPDSDEYYEKINSRMRQVFPDQFADGDSEEEAEKPRRKASVVAPATRSTAPKKITLTASQVAIAKRLGVPLELYARKVAEEMRK